MKGSYLDESRASSEQGAQAYGKFRRGRAREGEHEQLFALDVLLDEQGRELVHENAGLAASRASAHDDVLRSVLDDLHLPR